MTPIEKQCKEAMERIVRWLNLSCARHKYELRGKRKLP